MPSFTCTVCGDSFDVPKAALDKYPGWEPRYCRDHSPSKKRRGGGRRKRGGGLKEENLTLAEVLARYDGGPDSGVFTDGSCHPNPGRGGWGVVWVRDGEVVEQRYGKDPDTTNNRMELTAIIEGYKLLPEDAELDLYSDSRLCVNTLNDWAKKWEAKGWTKKGGPIKNLELVKEAYALHRAHPKVRVTWIAAHNGARWNEYADSLSTAWAREDL